MYQTKIIFALLAAAALATFIWWPKELKAPVEHTEYAAQTPEATSVSNSSAQAPSPTPSVDKPYYPAI